ncbi:carbohydrate ABC transporter permease [Kineococcus sp. SYSU DK006]|uniref:carbohydrate ABC transporter permease n=1 Tax=Kineococcus sp. SYSU DK006 TaxID=3383127 RepID=UPI003D7DC89E
MSGSSKTAPLAPGPRPGPEGAVQAPPAVRQGRSAASAARRRRWALWWFVAPAAVFMLAYFAVPVVNNITMSFREYTTATFYTGEAPFVGLDNYVTVVTPGIFARITVNTFTFTFVSLGATFVIGLLLALFFNTHFRLNAVLRSLILLPWLLPLIISAAVWRRMMDAGSGVLNQIIGAFGFADVPWLTDPRLALYSVILVNVWVGIPFVMVILYGGLQEIPRDLYEAASLDGATGVRAFTAITWPLLRPVVVIVLMLGFIYTVRVLDIVLALTGGGPADATQTYATQAYQLSFTNFEFGTGAALSNILIIVTLAVSVFQLRANRRANDLAG